MGTELIIAYVGVVRFDLGTLVLDEFPVLLFPATATAIITISLAEQGLVCGGVGRAINTFLLRDVIRHFVGLFSDGALENRCGTEGPAGAAAAQVFDFGHEAVA